MNALRFWFAIFAVIGVIIVAPAWVHFSTTGLADNIPMQTQWLVALTLPMMLMLLIASWLQPAGGP